MIENTGSELILFFVILAAVSLPLYIAVLKGRKAEKQHEREREKHILEVIRENSMIIAELKTTLEKSGMTNKEALDRIHKRIDDQGKDIKGIATDIAQIKLKLANISKLERAGSQ